MSLYEYKNGFGKKIYWPYTLIVVIITLCLLFGSLSIYSTVKSNQLRATNDQLTERLSESTDACTRLAGELRECTITIDQCRNYCTELGAISERNISSIRDAVETIEEERYFVQCLEMELGLWDSDSYYEWCDNWLQTQGVELDWNFNECNNKK